MKTPTDATKVFYPATRTGTGAAASVTGVGFPPDLAMINVRDSIGSRGWVDKLRGPKASVLPAYTDAEKTSITSGDVKSFDMAGISFSGGSDQFSSNSNGLTYVNHFFRRAPGFFDVVAYTGTGSNTTVSHNLGVAPKMIIFKSRSNALAWLAYHADSYNPAAPTTPSYRLRNVLNSDAAATVDTTYQTAVPTATNINIGTRDLVNTSAATYIAYLFATCPGVSKVGSYTGSGTTKQIDCGFTAGARFVLIKRTDDAGGGFAGDWYVWDSARGIVAGNDPYLLLNSTAAEVTNTDYIDPLNSGFEISSTAPAAINANGGSFIFLAIA